MAFFETLSRCDMHPQCDQGEDEENCEKEYKEKGYIDKTHAFKTPRESATAFCFQDN